MSDLSTRLDVLSRKKRAALLELIRKKKGEPGAGAAPPLPPRAPAGDLPLSFAQQRLWFIDRLAPGSPLYNVPGSVRCTGRLDPAVLAACLSEVVRRHDALRTRFEIRGGAPVQIVEPARPLPLPLIDLAALPEAARDPEAQRLLRAGNLAPFDLARPPLVRALLLRLGAEEHLFSYVFHHIASDGWSLDVAIREVAALYPALLEGRPSPLPELPFQYADFAWNQVQTLRDEVLDRELAWWRPRLSGAPALELPTDRPRPPVPSFRGASTLEPLPPALEAGLRGATQRERVTLFMAWLAPFCALLGRLAGTGDVVVGTVVSGRERPDLRGLIGFFVNTLVLRFDLSADPDCAALLAQSREVVLGAFSHQALPFEKLVDELGLARDPYRPPLLRVVFQFFPFPPSVSFPGLSLEPYHLSSETSKFDLLINAMELNGRLLVEWRHDMDLFDTDTLARWAGSFDVLLGAWLENPALRVSELPLLTAAQRHQLLAAWKPEPAEAGRERRSLPALFEAQVDRAPEAPALPELTYRELDARANRLARWLVGAGVVPGDRVALRLERSADLVVALLAVLKTGAAYVPLDPAAPGERLAFALEDSGASLVLDAAFLEGRAEAIARQSAGRLGIALDPGLPAYVIYTSGSTGRPKGVIIPHGHVARLLSATDAWFGFSSEDVWTLFHSYAFDFSVWEIWGALLYGGRLVVVPWSVSRDPAAFLDLLRREGVTVLNQTPSAFRQLPVPAAPLPLRFVIFGGEALDPSMLEPWFDRQGNAQTRFINMYGITETTVHVTWRPLARQDAARPVSLIGRPIPDMTVHVLDRHLAIQPLGIPGEICVGGEGLAHGYLGRPDLTAARFVPDPFGPPGARLYRSGDLARRRPDGDLEYLGRIDHQVKIRGFRIELGEIEAALAALPGVREAAVLARRDGAAGEPRLVAYVTAGPEGAPALAGMRESLGRRLPDYMIPTALVVLDRLPLTSNGKVDRRALPAPESAPAAASGRAHVPPRDEAEAWCAGLFRQVLNLPAEREIGALDDFFELGGSSISGAVLVNRLQVALGEIVHVVVIFDHPTIEALAAYVRAEHPAAASRLWGGEALPGDRTGEADAAPAGPADLAEMRRLIVEGRPEPEVRTAAGPLNPPALFLLSPPRSGSTLLRLMLGAHPRLFAPPELELLSFQTLAGRRDAFPGRDRFWLEGVTRAVMEARSCDAAEAERIVAAATEEGWSTRRFYRELQGWIGGRLLVDKTPSYALDPAVLRRGEEWFAESRYVHLVRHPQATIRSFEEARLDQIFFRRPHRFMRGQLAELIWTVSHQNILGFLAEIPPARQWTVRFEDLVREPGSVLAGLCGFLGLEYEPAMADPYGAAPMADGVHAESRMLGDVKFLLHGKVDASAADRWRQEKAAPLGQPARQLAAVLGFDPGGEIPLARVPREGPPPLSFAQQRLWFLDRLQPGSPAYNIPSFFRLEGLLDPALLERVLGELVRRHESLRTTFEERGGEPCQRIHPPLPFRLPRVDLGGLPEAVRAGEARRLAREEGGRGFSLERGPLLRATLLRLGEQEHVLLTTVHHVVSDGWSTGVMAREVSVLYDAFRQGLPSPLPELPVQYADFAVWQRRRLAGEALESELAFWRRRLAGLPAVLELPTDRPRLPVQGFRGAVTPLVLGPGLSAALAALGRRERTTPFMTLLAAFQVLLGRLTGQERFGVGTPVAGRNRVEIEPLIGFFVNTLVLRADLSAGPDFLELLRRVREEALEAQVHQDLPFEKLVEGLEIERSLSHTPLFQVMFAFQNAAADARLDLPGLALLPVDPGSEVAKFDLGLTLGGDAGGLAGALDYSTDLFDGTTIQRLAGHLQALLEALAADPCQEVWSVPLLGAAESHQLLVEWNDTEAASEPLLHRLVEEQAVRTPGAIAVEAGDVRLTYAELVERARSLARRLRGQGIMALSAERSPELIVQMLAVLQAGAAYLPIDPAYPQERREHMVVDSGAVWLKDFKDTKDGKDTALDVAPASPAYVIYTSGSTGRPKGVVVPHRAIASFVRTARETYGIAPGDRVLQFASISFDTSAEEIWPALAAGATLVLRPEEMASSIAHFSREVERLGITCLDLPTAFWHEMAAGMEAEGLELPRGLRLVILGGEEALADRLALWHRRAGPAVRLVNTYGPTETTVVATRRDLSGLARGGAVPIGRPIPGMRAYVLDRFLAPVPPGVRGELWIGGSGVAQGYLGRPDLTAERFMPEPFGGRLYRTGDLAFLRPDGDLVFAGRADRQLKIRGYRIEPGEIEAVLRSHPAIREAVVVAREDGPGDRSLVAFLVADGEARWREWASERLPAFMVPAAFVPLEALPLTPSGKVDRRALSQIAPERAASADRVAPRTPVEETLAGLFVEILGAERTGGRAGVHDSFFALGGHSLLATRLVAAVRDVFRVELPLRLLFEQPTVEGLARAIEEAGEGGAPDEPVLALPREPGENRFPVSFAQLREWILDRLEPGNPAYNIPNHLRIEGPLSVPALIEALRGIVRRHEVFRTAFVAGDEEPLQLVFPEVPLNVPLIDLSAFSDEAREAELLRRIGQEAATGFDLSTAPLLRARIIRLGPEDHALLLTVHHIVSDGWSMSILNQELAALCEAPLPPLSLQYADYAVWQRHRLDGETLNRLAGHWRQRLAGAPPLLELPTDRPRPPVRSNRGGKVPVFLPQPLAGRLEELARRRGMSLFMVLLAGYQSLLARWSGQEDVVVGTYSGNRPRRELEGLIGFFISTLVLRTSLAGHPSFDELAGRVRETTLEAYAHRDVPFEKLLEALQLPRDPSRTPLFQALLVLQNFPPARADLSTGVRLSGLPVESETSHYDLALWLGEGEDGIAGTLQYSTDLFEEETAARFAAHLRTLLESAAAGPGRNIWTLPLVGGEEQARQLAAWSRGPAVPAGESLLHRLVEEQAARTPGAVALEAGGVRLTCAELVERASGQANRLRGEGIGPGSIVALSAERTPELIISMLAVLQVGAAYLPIDPAWPRERQEYMVADSGAIPVNAAYVIYTSGSTGLPKGVAVPHRAIASFVRAAREDYELAPGDRVLQFASISFDTSAEEIWPALASGATLVLRPEDMAASIPHFLRELERLGITVLDLPTAFWHEMVAGMEAEDLELPQSLRLVILGGEEALADRLALWQRRTGSAVRLVNTYGPTETTVVATRRELSDLSPGGTVPIGRPIAGARAHVLDRFFAPVPPGVRGELWIGGAGVAQGYLGRPDLTAERFVPDPFAEEPGARLYRTGDLAVLKPDGDLVFAGRADRQLKIRGYRIEPGEIEAALRLYPAVREAVVDARGPYDARRLVAWIVPREGIEAPGASELREHLRGRLPEPLLPAVFAPLAALPLTPSGKLDRQALAEPAEARPENVVYAEPQSALERTIAEIYRDLLRVGRVGLQDNFFDLGGHSLLIVRAHQKLKAALGREIPVLDLFRFPTVAALARHLGGEETGNLQKVQSLAERQRSAQQRQRAAMERLRRPDRR